MVVRIKKSPRGFSSWACYFLCICYFVLLNNYDDVLCEVSNSGCVNCFILGCSCIVSLYSNSGICIASARSVSECCGGIFLNSLTKYAVLILKMTIVVPDEYGRMYELPADILRVIRSQFTDSVPYYLDSPGSISLFAYEDDSFCLYPYVTGYNTGRNRVVTVGAAVGLEDLQTGMVFPPESTRIGRDGTPSTVFNIPMLQQGDLQFFRIKWAENRWGEKIKVGFSSAPNDIFPEF